MGIYECFIDFLSEYCPNDDRWDRNAINDCVFEEK